MIRTYVANKIDRRPFKKVLSFLFWVIICLIVVFEAITIADKITNYNVSLFGNRLNVISSDSMSYVNRANEERLSNITDRYYKGDYIITHEYSSFDDVKVNDVITYFNGETLVCHRVIETINKNDTFYVITQGDANSSNDGLIKYDLIKGKVVGSCRYLGYLTLYLQSSYGIFAICSIAFVVICGIIIYEIINNKYKEI